MKTYKEKIAPGIEALVAATSRINESNSDLAHSIVDDLYYAEDLLLNPFQTVPADRWIQITTSFCDPEGNSDNADDHDIDFKREISAANLYIILQALVKYYDPEYKLSVNIGDLEVWLNQQKPLLKTVRANDFGCIEDTGLTIAEFKTEYGSIDFFIEFGICFPEE